MGVPIMNQARAVLNALDEGRVEAVVFLYDYNLLKQDFDNSTRRADIRKILVTHLKLEGDNADYWLDWFGVK